MTRRKRMLGKLAACITFGVLTTLAVSWAFAAFGHTAGRPVGQGLYTDSLRTVPFGRADAWGMTKVYWRVTANDGGPMVGAEDDLYQLPAWSAARRLPPPFPPASDFSKLVQTFEIATGWPFVAMRSQFHDYLQGTPWPKGNPYVTVSGFPLPTRKVGGAFQAAALPYVPIWPGFLADSVIYAIYWLALLVGLRCGRRIYRAARGCCLNCGYVSSGLPADAPCPECGTPAGDTRALGRMWPATAAAGVVLLAAAAVGAVVATGQIRGLSVQRLEPLWLLRWEAGGSDPSAALEEINRRLAANSIPPPAARTLVDRALASQADAAAPWRYRWGDLVEKAHADGLCTDEQWKRYARQAVRFKLHPRPKVRIGDTVLLLVEREVRVGRGMALGLHVAAALPALDSVKGSVRPNAHRSVGDLTDTTMLPTSAGSSLPWTLQPPDPSWQESNDYDVAWPRAAHEGLCFASVDLTVQVIENSFPGPPMPMRPAKTTLIVETIEHITGSLEVVRADQETVRLRAPESTRPIVQQIRNADATLAPWAKPRVERSGPKLIASGAIEFPRSPIGLAFDVYWRRGEREWHVGRVSTPAHANQSTHSYHGTVDAFEPGPVQIVLRPSPEAARNEPQLAEIWGEEVVLPELTVDPPPPPPAGPHRPK